MNTHRRVIFVGGVPAIGKTYFGRWLSREYGFTHVELEQKRARDEVALTRPWSALRNHGDATPLAVAVTHLGPSVVLDWGFPPTWLFAVRRFADDGAELWWFDGDRARAREEFKRRSTSALDCFDRQLAKIDRWWPEITAVFRHRQLHVLQASGERMQPAVILTKMNHERDFRYHRPTHDNPIPYRPKSISG